MISIFIDFCALIDLLIMDSFEGLTLLRVRRKNPTWTKMLLELKCHLDKHATWTKV